MIIILITIVWYGLGLIVAGFWRAWRQRQFPEIARIIWNTDRNLAFFIAIAGPIGAVSLRLADVGGFSYGWMNPFGKRKV